MLLLAGFRMETFFILWILFALSPSLTLLFSKMAPIGERYLYLPSVGFTILLAIFLSRIKQTTLLILIAVFCAGSYGFLTYERLKDWQSEKTLWEDTAMKRPDSATANTNYGRALIEEKDYTNGKETLLLALKQKTSPQQKSNIYDLLGVVEMRQKNFSEAEEYFKRALKSNAGNHAAMNNLGVLYLRMSESEQNKAEQKELLSKAVTTFENILAISPHFIQPKFNLALALLQQGKYDRAEEYFDAVIENDPRGRFASQAIQFLLVIELEKRKAER